MKVSLTLSLIFALGTWEAAQGFSSAGPDFDKCTKAEYYADLFAQKPQVSSWTQEDVIDLITKTHRNVLENVSPVENGDDIILALKNLWKTDSPDSQDRIRLVYRDVAFRANLANSQLGWERGDLWAKGRGWNSPNDTEAWTDIYGKAPVDSTVNERKANKFFGVCNTVEFADKCVKPATSETDETTEQDGKIFAPPNVHKGDVARALFYMAARYRDTLGLTLTDCAPFEDYEFGYLSELLRWNLQDDVSDEEKARNDMGCERWQGNRNPFVDYPQLVDLFYPDGPDQVIPSAYTYSRCTEPTSPPTADPNACSDIMPGDTPLFLINSDDPDQVVFVTLEDIPESVGQFYMTDNHWDGTKFAKNEGTLLFDLPEGGLPAGEVFGFGDNSPYAERWTQLPDEGNRFDLQQIEGDNIFLYCLNADNIPNVIAGFSFAGPWKEDGLTSEEYGTSFSALPSNLEKGGSVFLDHFDNCVYVGPLRNVEKAQLVEHMIDPQFFDCINDPRIQLDITSSGTKMATAISAILASAALFCILW